MCRSSSIYSGAQRHGDYFVVITDLVLNPLQTIAARLADSFFGSAIPIKFADTVEEAKKWVVEVFKEKMRQAAKPSKK